MKQILILFYFTFFLFSCNKQDHKPTENFYFTGRAYDLETEEPVSNVQIEIILHSVPPGILSKEIKYTVANVTTDGKGFYKVKPEYYPLSDKNYNFYTYNLNAPNSYNRVEEIHIDIGKVDTTAAYENVINIPLLKSPLVKHGYLKINFSATDTITSEHTLQIACYNNNDVVSYEYGTFIYSYPSAETDNRGYQTFNGKIGNGSILYNVLRNDTATILYRAKRNPATGGTFNAMKIFCGIEDTTFINLSY